KRIAEERVNAYAISPENAPSISINLVEPTDSQYIDYDSVQISLRSSATGETTILNPDDLIKKDAFSILQDNIEFSNYGFYTNSHYTLEGTVSSSGTAVTGVGTKFFRDLKVGDTIKINATDRTVVAINSDTTLTIDSSLTESGVVYSVLRGVFQPQKGSKQTYNAAVGDFLYLKRSGGDVLTKIKQVTPN